MELNVKDILKEGAEQLLNTARKLQDKGYVDKAVEVGSAVLKGTVETVSKTKEYLVENRLTPGAKDAYIQELEEKLAKKDQQIRKMERQLKKKSWSGRNKGKK